MIQHRGKDHENMVGIGETEEQQDVVKRSRMKEVCLECADSTIQKILDDALISELRNRLELAGQQATHLIGQVSLLERHLEEKDRELTYTRTVDVPEWEAVAHDLTEKLEWQSEQSRRLEENLDNATRELTSNQHDLLIAKERIENLGSRQQYEDEQHRATIADLESLKTTRLMLRA